MPKTIATHEFKDAMGAHIKEVYDNKDYLIVSNGKAPSWQLQGWILETLLERKMEPNERGGKAAVSSKDEGKVWMGK